ncbi:initiator tRNA phosphoribosyl transferase-domain-containing protein [Ampelomyces quisqualis]|uniref:Initiator tRNA phosphoribosyl transferase-domain-containing protein n=1 Tax=Ampelomyces quisqualis TaxID=50730 RepID=A0A6A5QLG1_AMPQU|nr:initiator tRNA phosphoribosyl transferase-domain-containing protein [Ampelomyces quisqualis]
MTQPLSELDIIFPHLSNNPKFSSTLISLKRSALSIHNRLNSITLDSKFVTSVSEAYQLPLVANERCGSWYIHPEKKAEGVYFKSTDGHMSQWGFSLRRLNLQLLDVVQKHGGAVVVDSTRRGKSMPDALSKTIPIWCCVINRTLFGTDGEHAMYTPPQAVSSSEHAQISSKIDGFVQQFLEICKPNVPELRAKLQKPLRPIWVTQQSSLPDPPTVFEDFHPVVLCTASRRVQGAESSEGGYVQGAADDHEAWSHGLTPPVFWKNKDLLMSASDEDAPAIISELLEQAASVRTSSGTTLIKPTSTLYIAATQNIDLSGFDIVITCTPEPLPLESIKAAKLKHYLPLICRTGKLGSRDLRTELSLLPTFLSSLHFPSAPPKILLSCPTGTDLSVGAALTVLCLFSDDHGNIDLSTQRSEHDIDKILIKQRLSWITTSNPSLNPSRTTLQSVNNVLFSGGNAQQMRAQITDRMHTAIKPLHHHHHVPKNIFTALQNTDWKFHRTLTSALPTHPSGTVDGTATFTPVVVPTTPPTLLYAEQGEFVTDTGLTFTARRKYVYQLLSEDEGGSEGVVVKFFDDEAVPRGSGVGRNGEGIGGVFVEMGDVVPGESGQEVMRARNKEQHLCAEDLYTAAWEFGAGMVGKEGGVWWEVRYDVKGPKKDYVSRTRYERVKNEV